MNPDNFCYMNSCMQALMSLDEFVDHYLRNGDVIARKLCEIQSKANPGAYFTAIMANFFEESLLNPHETAYNP